MHSYLPNSSMLTVMVVICVLSRVKMVGKVGVFNSEVLFKEQTPNIDVLWVEGKQVPKGYPIQPIDCQFQDFPP